MFYTGPEEAGDENTDVFVILEAQVSAVSAWFIIDPQ